MDLMIDLCLSWRQMHLKLGAQNACVVDRQVI